MAWLGEGLDDREEEDFDALTEAELTSGQTEDPGEASDEGMPYVPPSDPPVIPSNQPGGLTIASGFGATSLDEPYDADHHAEPLTEDDEVSARVREAFRADAIGSHYAEMIAIAAEGETVFLAGDVEDLSDEDTLVALAEDVDGVAAVVSRLWVAGLE